MSRQRELWPRRDPHPLSNQLLSGTRRSNWAIKIHTSSTGSGRRHAGRQRGRRLQRLRVGDKNRTRRVYDYWTHRRLGLYTRMCAELGRLNHRTYHARGSLILSSRPPSPPPPYPIGTDECSQAVRESLRGRQCTPHRSCFRLLTEPISGDDADIEARMARYFIILL